MIASLVRDHMQPPPPAVAPKTTVPELAEVHRLRVLAALEL